MQQNKEQAAAYQQTACTLFVILSPYPQLLTMSLILLLSALLISVISVENRDKKTLKAA